MNGAPIAGATQATLLIPGNGCYTLTIFEDNCSSISNSICVTNTSIDELTKIQIYITPHPVTSVSVVETFFDPGSTTTLQLTDITGKTVIPSWKQQGTSFEIDKKNLPPGFYFLTLSNSNYHSVIRKKIIFL